MRTRRSLPWLLMLLLLAAGVAGMHTLGHAAGGHTTTHATAHSPAVHVMQDSDCCGAAAAVPVAANGHRPEAPMTDPTVMCLAILGAAVLIAFALVMLSRPGPTTPPTASTSAITLRPGRGPPRALLGLTLADLSVLRN